MLTRKGRPLAKSVSELRVEGQVMPPPPCAIVVHAAAWEDVGRIGIYDLSGCLAGQSAQIGQRVLASHGHVARRALHTPHAAQPQRALLCEGAPLSREAVAQQHV